MKIDELIWQIKKYYISLFMENKLIKLMIATQVIICCIGIGQLLAGHVAIGLTNVIFNIAFGSLNIYSLYKK